MCVSRLFSHVIVNILLLDELGETTFLSLES